MDLFNTFPTQWEWVALIIGVVSFLMAVQPFTQMIWGRPEIELEYDKVTLDGVNILEGNIFNRPPASLVLRWLRVRRETAENIAVAFSIRRHHTNELVVPFILPDIVRRGTNDPKGARYVNLPASTLAYGAFGVVFESPETGLVTVFGKDIHQPLAPGSYVFQCTVMEADSRRQFTKRFTVFSDNRAHWAKL